MFSLLERLGKRDGLGPARGRSRFRAPQPATDTDLTFDSNDSYSLAADLREDRGASYQLQYVRDNRRSPDQRHLPLVYRTPLPEGQRLTLDLLRKQSLVDDVTLHRWGASVGYDWPAFFVRVAYDPTVNFTAYTMWRPSAGARFWPTAGERISIRRVTATNTGAAHFGGSAQTADRYTIIYIATRANRAGRLSTSSRA